MPIFFFHTVRIYKVGISFRLSTLNVVAYFYSFLKIPIRCLTIYSILEQKKCGIIIEHLYTLQSLILPGNPVVVDFHKVPKAF